MITYTTHVTDERRTGWVPVSPTDTAEAALARAEPDPVNHPAHYCRNGLEAIQVIEAFGLNYRLGNVVKYVLRAGHKTDALEDLRKARWYLEREIKRRESDAS